MTTLTTLRTRRHARLVSRQVLEYTAHRWPVAALAVPDPHAGCPCGSSCAAPHLASTPIRSPEPVDRIWAPRHRWDIALVAADFDIVELPPTSGAALHQFLVTSCPTMTVWRGRRWYFVVEADTVPAANVDAAGGHLHTGADAWVPAPPTRLAPGGRLYWVVNPLHTRWRPYRRGDAIDNVLNTTHPAQRGDAPEGRQRDATEDHR